MSVEWYPTRRIELSDLIAKVRADTRLRISSAPKLGPHWRWVHWAVASVASVAVCDHPRGTGVELETFGAWHSDKAHLIAALAMNLDVDFVAECAMGFILRDGRLGRSGDPWLECDEVDPAERDRMWAATAGRR